MPHWGREHTWVTTARVYKMAKKMIKAGADLNERNEFGENIITLALHSERHFWAVYTDTRIHDNFFSLLQYSFEINIISQCQRFRWLAS